jgi:hypothetical protein
LSQQRDLSLYFDTLAAWDIPLVTERIGFLKELAALFVVAPANLPSLLAENYLARVKGELLAPYLACRTDFDQFSPAQKHLFAGLLLFFFILSSISPRTIIRAN